MERLFRAFLSIVKKCKTGLGIGIFERGKRVARVVSELGLDDVQVFGGAGSRHDENPWRINRRWVMMFKW